MKNSRTGQRQERPFKSCVPPWPFPQPPPPPPLQAGPREGQRRPATGHTRPGRCANACPECHDPPTPALYRASRPGSTPSTGLPLTARVHSGSGSVSWHADTADRPISASSRARGYDCARAPLLRQHRVWPPHARTSTCSCAPHITGASRGSTRVWLVEQTRISLSASLRACSDSAPTPVASGNDSGTHVGSARLALELRT